MRKATFAASIALAAATQCLPAVAAVQWDLYTVVGIGHPIAVQLQNFSDEVKKRSNGDLVITVRPAGELPFKPTEVVKITGEGQVQLGEALASFTVGTIPMMGVTGLPMFLTSAEQLQKAMPIVRKHAAEALEKRKVKVLFQFMWPFAQIYGSGKPIRTVSDFSGRKLRVLSPMGAEMLKRFGASSVSLTTPEVPVALERGTIEGMIANAFQMVGAKWAENVKWSYESDFNAVDDYIIMNTAAYSALAPSTRAALDAVAQEWGPKMSAANLEGEKTSRALLETQYKLELVTATKADRDHMTKLMESYWTTWAKDNGPEAVRLLSEVRGAIGK